MERNELRRSILYPVTRVRAGTAGGSGVLIYSGPDPKTEEKYIKGDTPSVSDAGESQS